MDNGGPFYVHISYIFNSGEFWVVYMSHIYYKHLPWRCVRKMNHRCPWKVFVINVRHIDHLEFTTVEYVGDVYVKWTTIGGIYVSHLLQTLTMDNGGPFYVHISYKFYSGELWVVYMSHIYNKHLPWTMVVHPELTTVEYVGDVYVKWTTIVHGKCLL
jgi:hypothetical protein